ncbi:AAA family ATPase [Eubacterium oxidoreducens]|uniref:Cytidylate kinase n=1 Tax=Eubacterium oxidoreducens TaxID=1732 RepID=A0A1G6BHF9_EUBOX|nr:cytidylate kinase-like family protein [Eubacterium oxidoreducens]SDB20072.1 Cytidylate kinase [Eubacterium oxidoreducens]
MKHFVIAIGCDFGAGGIEIAKLIAGKLGVEYYDRYFIDEIVKKTAAKRSDAEKADMKKGVLYGMETGSGVYYTNLSKKAIKLQEEIIQELAKKDSCIIVGRSANYYLRNREDVLSIYIYAPKEAKIKHIMEEYHISEKKAAEMHKEKELALHARHKQITGTYRGDRYGRQLMIDSTLFGYVKTADYICRIIQEKFKD